MLAGSPFSEVRYSCGQHSVPTLFYYSARRIRSEIICCDSEKHHFGFVREKLKASYR